MSTATLQAPRQSQRASSAQGHRQFLRSSDPQNTRSASNPHPTNKQYEKAIVVKHVEASQRREVEPPESYTKDPKEKELGISAKHLKFSDFELMKTLGTGQYIYLCPCCR